MAISPLLTGCAAVPLTDVQTTLIPPGGATVVAQRAGGVGRVRAAWRGL